MHFMCSLNISSMTDNLLCCVRFVYKVIINQKEYPEGRGRSAKEAKQKAAELAWSELNKSDFSSQVKPIS